MFSTLKSLLGKISGNKFNVVAIIAIVVFVVFMYSGSKSFGKDFFDGPGTVLSDTYQNPPLDTGAMPSAPVSAGSDYTMKPVANPSDLLPVDGNSQWTDLNPAGRSGAMMPDLLQAGYHIGLDTIGQTLKNANLQLRSDPVIAKKDTGPWNMSTYEGDPFRVPLELGAVPSSTLATARSQV